MYKIVNKKLLSSTVVQIDVEAPLVAKKAQPGQFIILRVDKDGERIPLTVAGYNREKGTVTVIFQTVGATTLKLSRLEEGEHLHDFVGPLGRATQTEGLKKVAVVAGGVGCAIAYPVACKLFAEGVTVHTVVGFRTKELVILENEMKESSSLYRLVTDDGSAGEKGFVTTALEALLDNGEEYDEVITVGPLVMMKAVCELTKKYNVKTIASMNPIMIDGTGMCGGCRLTVGGKTVFACVDGPEFDGHQIDFDEAISRASIYRPFESKVREQTCNLLNEDAKA